MRTPRLQSLYLQKPLTLIILIATLSVLPWVGMGEYYTKGEPREASVAISMLKGEVILPYVYADEFAYKPPLMHWLTAAFSLPRGEVTPLTSRLPSALAFIVMVGVCFAFFGKKLRKGHEGFIACLVMITSFELHRAAMTSRVDMLLTAFMVIGMICLFFWEENKQLKGLPWYIPLLLGAAALTKGPVGVILPLLIFGIYLLILRYKFSVVVWKLTLMGILSVIPLFIWYYLAYMKAGEELIDLMWAENFGRFLGLKKLAIQYSLGHTFPRYYTIIYLLAGFLPWTLLLFFSLFGLKLSTKILRTKDLSAQICSMNRVKLFSLIAAVTIFIFYCIPSGRRSVYLMPAYPFIAIFIAQYMLYLAEYKSKIFRFFSLFLTGLTGLATALCLLSITGILKPYDIIAQFTQHSRTLHDVSLFTEALSKPTFLYILLLGVLLYSLGASVYYLRRKNNLKLLYATFSIYFAFNLLLDGVALPAFKNGTSIKPFISELKTKYDFKKEKVYVMNNLLEYDNLYGPNFYMGNIFRDFEAEQPESGFLMSFPANMAKMQEAYKGKYTFELVEESPDRYNDVRNVVQLYTIEKLQ